MSVWRSACFATTGIDDELPSCARPDRRGSLCGLSACSAGGGLAPCARMPDMRPRTRDVHGPGSGTRRAVAHRSAGASRSVRRGADRTARWAASRHRRCESRAHDVGGLRLVANGEHCGWWCDRRSRTCGSAAARGMDDALARSALGGWKRDGAAAAASIVRTDARVGRRHRPLRDRAVPQPRPASATKLKRWITEGPAEAGHYATLRYYCGRANAIYAPGNCGPPPRPPRPPPAGGAAGAAPGVANVAGNVPVGCATGNTTNCRPLT